MQQVCLVGIALAYTRHSCCMKPAWMAATLPIIYCTPSAVAHFLRSFARTVVRLLVLVLFLLLRCRLVQAKCLRERLGSREVKSASRWKVSKEEQWLALAPYEILPCLSLCAAPHSSSYPLKDCGTATAAPYHGTAPANLLANVRLRWLRLEFKRPLIFNI